MTIDDLLNEINSSGSTNIEVIRRQVKHGNRDNEGDYETLTMKTGKREITFKETDSGWVKI